MAAPQLSALRTFEVAARHLSFTKAAGELHITQGAVSQQIKQFEASLGFALFHRGARGLSLTEKGQDLAETVQSVLRRLYDKIDGCRLRRARRWSPDPAGFADRPRDGAGESGRGGGSTTSPPGRG